MSSEFGVMKNKTNYELEEEGVMDEERFDFGKRLRTPNSELRTPLTLDEVLSQVQSCAPKRVLFWGDGAGGISSYVAGWMAGKGIDVILLDGANCFNPYMVSSFARKALIPPEKLLRRIRIARAFTCYQMATLMGERLVSLLRQEEEAAPRQKPWVIVLGPI